MKHGCDLPTLGRLVSSEIGFDELQSYVRKRAGLSVHQFHLKAADNGLILCGLVRSYYAKQLIQEAVMERTTIPIASNEIRVASTVTA